MGLSYRIFNLQQCCIALEMNVKNDLHSAFRAKKRNTILGKCLQNLMDIHCKSAVTAPLTEFRQ